MHGVRNLNVTILGCYKNGCYIRYDITNLKFNNCKGKNSKYNLIATFLSPINLDEHVSTKINTFRIYKGGLGGLAAQKQKKFLKKIS